MRPTGPGPERPEHLRRPDRSGDAATAPWLTILGGAVARGEASPEALHPRVATVAIVPLRNEFVVRGIPGAPDDVLVEIVDEVYLGMHRDDLKKSVGTNPQDRERTRFPRVGSCAERKNLEPDMRKRPHLQQPPILAPHDFRATYHLAKRCLAEHNRYTRWPWLLVHPLASEPEVDFGIDVA